MSVCLERGADLHTAQLMPLPLTVSCFSKIRLVLPFWYRPTRVVLEKGPLDGCVCVCVCVCFWYWPTWALPRQFTLGSVHAERCYVLY